MRLDDVVGDGMNMYKGSPSKDAALGQRQQSTLSCS